MTVNELVNMLQDFDDDTEVVLALYQRYGGDFAYDIRDVSKDKYDNWDYGKETCVQIVLGGQIGYMCGEDDEDY